MEIFNSNNRQYKKSIGIPTVQKNSDINQYYNIYIVYQE